jgi:hypothetical protein
LIRQPPRDDCSASKITCLSAIEHVCAADKPKPRRQRHHSKTRANGTGPLWVTCGRRPGKNFLTFCSIGRVRSRVRPVSAAGMAAGPNALRGSGPKQTGALWKWCVDPNGFSRSPERPYLHYVVMPSPIDVTNPAAGLPHAASNSFGSLYLSLRTMMAQAIRAILLASATAATFVGRRSINRPSHGRFPVPCLRA